MTNLIKGVVTRELGGERYEFRLAANEWCELEEHFGKSTAEIVKQYFSEDAAEKASFRVWRVFFQAALSKSRPGITVLEAGDIMSAFGLQDAAKIVVEAVVASFPKATEGASVGKPRAAKASR